MKIDIGHSLPLTSCACPWQTSNMVPRVSTSQWEGHGHDYCFWLEHACSPRACVLWPPPPSKHSHKDDSPASNGVNLELVPGSLHFALLPRDVLNVEYQFPHVVHCILDLHLLFFFSNNNLIICIWSWAAVNESGPAFLYWGQGNQGTWTSTWPTARLSMRSGKQQINPLEKCCVCDGYQSWHLGSWCPLSLCSFSYALAGDVFDGETRTFYKLVQSEPTDWVGGLLQMSALWIAKYLITERGRGLTGFWPDRYWGQRVTLKWC